MRKIILPLILFLSCIGQAQDPLPDFSVVNKGGNRIVISWNNNFKQVKQISIQRSTDSLSNFKTLITVPDPNNRQNGYMDAKAPGNNMFYRLYILVDGSNFMFSRSLRPVSHSIRNALVADSMNKQVTDSNYLKLVNKIIKENLPDTALTQEEILTLKKYSNKTVSPDPVSGKIDPPVKNNIPDPALSMYKVAANKDGLVRISLTDFKEKKYTIRFYEDDDTFLFELKDIKEASLTMDKSNFYRSGWFKSELFDEGKLIEKNRFFIPKDF